MQRISKWDYKAEAERKAKVKAEIIRVQEVMRARIKAQVDGSDDPIAERVDSTATTVE